MNNAALGVAVDLLVAPGGTAIPSETPEIYGAEHLLTRRAISPEVGRGITKRRCRGWDRRADVMPQPLARTRRAALWRGPCFANGSP